MKRQEAISRGLRRYIADKPCNRGHFERYVISRGCVVCAADNQRRRAALKPKELLHCKCVICGEIFTTNRWHPKTTCSSLCKRERVNRYNFDWRHRQPLEWRARYLEGCKKRYYEKRDNPDEKEKRRRQRLKREAKAGYTERRKIAALELSRKKRLALLIVRELGLQI